MTQQQAPGSERAIPFVALVLGAVVAFLASLVVARIDDPDAWEEGPLVILSGRDDSVGGQRGRLIEEWNALHGDTNRASIRTLAPDADKQRVEMLADAQSDGPGADVFNLDVTWTAEFADAGYLRSVDESRVRSTDFLKGPLSTCRYAGRLWALPFNTDVGLLYYRTDLLGQIGRKDPPATWDRLVADVDRVRAGPAPAITGYAGQLADYEGLTVTAQEMIWGAGGTVVDDDGKVLPDAGDGRAAELALGRLRDLSPPGLPSSYEEDSLRDFRAGRALFMRNWPVAYRKLNQPSNEGPPPPFEVAQLPGGSGALGGQNLAVSARSTHPRAARALVEFLTSDRSQQLLFERGGFAATRRIVYTDPQVTSSPLTAKLLDALDNADRRPAVPHYAQFSKAFRAAVLERLNSTAPLDEDRMRSDLEAALQGG